MNLRPVLTTTLLAALAVSTTRTQAAFDMFLKFYPDVGQAQIVGESQDASYPGSQGWFELKQFDFGVQNPATIGSTTGGAGTGKASFTEFKLSKTVDSVSPALFKILSSGAHFKSARLVIRKSGGATAKPDPYLQYEFNTVFATAQHWGGSAGDDTPQEDVTLAVGEILISYKVQNPDGTLGKATTGGWSVISNSDKFTPLPDGP
ncbi:MAG TPA: type VI secretion system tube protein Hcp [Verrucomicrobiae bacterium]